MLSTAELLIGLTRHLRMYTLSADRAAVGQLEFAGQVLEMAMRLRGNPTATATRAVAIAIDAGIDKRRMLNDIVPTLETLGLIDVVRANDGQVEYINDKMPPLADILTMADSILAVAMPEPTEHALLKILDATAVMPQTHAACMELACEVASEEAAAQALDHLEALRLCSRQHSDDGPDVIYNPNVWAGDASYSNAAMRAEDGAVRAALMGLLEEISRTAGLPEDKVTSTEKKWIDFAVAEGLVLRSIVQTTSGEQRAFLFTPHMSRSAFASPTGVDPSGHVRQLIGSMVFAQIYATHQLWSPTAFLTKLVNTGEAGDASSIGTDYPMLETAGIVRVEPTKKYHRFVLLQSDVAEQALTYLNEQGGSGAQRRGGLREQRRYRQPEGERAKLRVELARTTDSSPAETAKLMAALRQEVGQRRYGR